MRTSHPALAALLCGLIVSCLPGGVPPEMSVKRGSVLGARGRGGARPGEGPFRVSFAGPAGGGVEVPQPQIVFSRPVRALADKPGEPRLTATFSPAVRGRWEWIGTSAARFVAEGGFAEATAYTMEIAPGLRSIDGEVLTTPVRLAFSTVPPRLLSCSPSEGQTEVSPHQSVNLSFNQTISRSELEAGITVVNRAGHVLPFTVEQDGDTWGPSVYLRPRERWPEMDRITIRVAEGVRSEGGLIPMLPREISFETISSLHVTSLDCHRQADGRCALWGQVSVHLSDQMRPSDFWPLVKITPRVAIRRPQDATEQPESSFTIDAEFKPGETYEIEILPSRRPPAPRPVRRGEASDPLRPLRVGAKEKFLFAPPQTGVSFSFRGTFVPFSHDELAARADDTRAATASVAALDRDLVMKIEEKQDTDILWDIPTVKDIKLPLRPSEKDPPAWQTLRDLTPDRPGPLLLGARWEGLAGAEKISRVLQRTDLSFHHRDAPDETLVWVTSIRTGMPVAGVSVEARDAAGHSVSGTTDKDGVVTLPTRGLGDVEPTANEPRWRQPRPWMVLFARKDDDWIYRRAERPLPASPRGALFTERGLYRPGETVSVKGLVRQSTKQGFDTLEGKTIRLVLTGPGGQRSSATEIAGAFGTFHHEFPVDVDAALGSYRVIAEIADRTVATETFRVKEYRPSSFSVDASFDRASYVRGDAAACRIQGTYLYGGSLLGARASVHLSRSPIEFQIPGLKGYTTADSARESTHLPDVTRSGGLDAAGRLNQDFSLDFADQRGAESVACEVAVTDAGLDMVGARSAAILHPSDVYVAIEDLRWTTLAPNQGVAPKVLVLTPDGVRRNQPARVELLEHRVRPGRPGDSLPGQVVSSCEVSTRSDPVSCRVITPSTPRDSVSHYTLRASTKDARGRTVVASVRLEPGRAPRPEPVAKKPKIKPKPEPKLEIAVREVPRGQVAHLQATSPFAQSQALFTFERDGILGHRVMSVGLDPVDVDFKVEEAAAPYVTATAFYVSPYSDDRHSRRAMRATTTISSGWSQHQLDVAVRPSKTQAVPGEAMDVEVEVHQADGAPASAEVTLYAADEATLALAAYHLPDPLAGFFEHRENTVVGGMTRDDLGSLHDWKEEIRRFGLGSIGTIGHGWGTGTGQGFGSGHGRLGGAAGSGARMAGPARQNFRQTAFFLPSLRTDEKGIARAHVQLPDSLTTYRVMAFAVTRGVDMGAGQSSIVTSKALQVRPVLPRVIRAGDHFVIGAMAANNGPTRLDAEVSIEARGLEVKGPIRLPVTLPAGGSQRLTFEVDAREVGKGQITLGIRGGEGLFDAAELPVEIESPVTLETAALHGTAEGRVDEQIGDLSGARPDVGSLDLSLSSSPLAGLGAGLDQLVSYPYGCTEQTTSRLVPLLPLRDLARALGVALPANLDQAARDAVRRLAGNQRSDGGFGLWPGSSGSSPWLSAYATWGLTEARRRGIPVDARVVEQARHYLLGVLGGWQGGSGDPRATAPFALDVLANDPDNKNPGLPIIADQIFREREGLPIFSKALLLHAMGLLGSPRADQEALITELTANLHLDGPLARHVGADPSHASLLDSTTRTSALILRSLALVSPRHPMMLPLAMGLLADRHGGTWRTTQEAAWSLLALDDYRRLLGEGATHLDGEVRLGAAPLLHQSFEAEAGAIAPEAHATVPLARLLGAKDQDLSFIGQGSSPLYYEARLRFAPRDLPAADVASGFEIHRRHILAPAAVRPDDQKDEGWRVDASRFKEGDLILDEVEVITSSTRRFVVIDDPIPGGFESVDLDLQGGPRWLRPYLRGRQTRVERRDDRVLFFLDEMPPGAYRYRHLVRATAAGRFVTPPAWVEEMYTPETFGLTAARVVTID